MPGDPKHIMYVWVDALTNYITGVGFPDTESETFKSYWPADLHVIGKDIVRFHAVYWPAFLMSAGIEVPRRIFSHGWILNRGEKMSKSVGNVVDPFALADAYGVDQLRYFFMREVLVRAGRQLQPRGDRQSHQRRPGERPRQSGAALAVDDRQGAGRGAPRPGAFDEADQAMLAAADAMLPAVREAMKTHSLHQVLNAVWTVVAEANRYFAAAAPWALAKTDPERQGTVLYVTAEVLRQVAILAQPFVPTAAQALLDLLAIPPDERAFREPCVRRIAPGSTLPAPKPIFPRYVEPEEAAAS